MSTDPSPHWSAADIRPVSRAIALAKTGDREWVDVFTLMQEYVGWELAGRWVAIELEIAGVIDPTDRKHGPHYGSGERRDLRPL